MWILMTMHECKEAVMSNLADFLAETARRQPQHAALRLGPITASYGELHALACADNVLLRHWRRYVPHWFRKFPGERPDREPVSGHARLPRTCTETAP
jgi:hypothetical protein